MTAGKQEQHALVESGKVYDTFDFEFEEVATSVEERFRRAYSTEAASEAKVESQMTYDQISMGWWLVMKRLGISMWISNEKPAIQSGDLLKISIQKRHAP